MAKMNHIPEVVWEKDVSFLELHENAIQTFLLRKGFGGYKLTNPNKIGFLKSTKEVQDFYKKSKSFMTVQSFHKVEHGVFRYQAEDMSRKQEGAVLYQRQNKTYSSLLLSDQPEELFAEHLKTLESGDKITYALKLDGTLPGLIDLNHYQNSCPLFLRDLLVLSAYTNAEFLPGINIPAHYLGETGSTFALHVEDDNLAGINLVVDGVKLWTIIPPAYYQQMRDLIQEIYEGTKDADEISCSSIDKHKLLYVSHELLESHNIPFHVTVQEPGETVIVFPGAYHQGFNGSTNACIAKNFVDSSWLDLAMQVKECSCRKRHFPYRYACDCQHSKDPAVPCSCIRVDETPVRGVSIDKRPYIWLQCGKQALNDYVGRGMFKGEKAIVSPLIPDQLTKQECKAILQFTKCLKKPPNDTLKTLLAMHADRRDTRKSCAWATLVRCTDAPELVKALTGVEWDLFFPHILEHGDRGGRDARHFALDPVLTVLGISKGQSLRICRKIEYVMKKKREGKAVNAGPLKKRKKAQNLDYAYSQRKRREKQ